MRATIVISSFREPCLNVAIEKAISQKTNFEYGVVVVAPDKEAEELVKKYKKKFKNLSFFRDPGKGKSFGLNLIFKELESDIWIFTDGDVYFDENAIANMVVLFDDKKVGCACGRIIPINSKDTMLGYWAHLLADAGAHRIRKKLSDAGRFLECSGYMFGFRKGLINQIPLNVAEDSYIPYVILKQGYTIKYSPNSMVFVKSPTTLKEFIKQRIRTAKAHTSLTDYFPDFPRVKSFKNEVKEGTFSALHYAKNLKEIRWTLTLFLFRFYIWARKFYDEKIINKAHYSDGWEKIATTKHIS